MEDYINFKNSIFKINDFLLKSINNIKINVVYKDIKVNLLDYLPLFKKGYTNLESLGDVFAIYQYIHKTEPFDFYSLFCNKIEDFKGINIVDIGYESDLIKSLHINHDKYEVDKKGNIKLESFLTNMNNGIDHEWIDLLIQSKLGLYVTIILHYEWVFEELLNEIDPRDYNNEAYHLAVRIGNHKIINMIKNKIIELNWLDKEVLIKEFKKYDFLSADIIKHYQSMKY